MSALILLLSLGGCNIVQQVLNNPAKMVEEADAKLKAGDLAGAAASYDAAVQKAPTDVAVATGAAYMKVLAGDFAAADAILAAAEPTAADKTGEVKLRRALVAMESGDLDKVKEFAAASNLPAGQLLAAEVELADGNRDAAKTLLEAAKADSGAVGATAGTYLEFMADANPLVAGLAEAQALWALGKRRIAVRSVEDLVKAYAESREDGADQLLLWAGRAAAVGESAIATNLLDAITVPPAGQGWRVQATRAIVTCMDGDGPGCLTQFQAMRAGAPADGYTDAAATAALGIAEKDPATAKQLLDGLQGDAVARAYAAIGDKASASAAVADPVLKSQLGG